MKVIIDVIIHLVPHPAETPGQGLVAQVDGVEDEVDDDDADDGPDGDDGGSGGVGGPVEWLVDPRLAVLVRTARLEVDVAEEPVAVILLRHKLLGAWLLH